MSDFPTVAPSSFHIPLMVYGMQLGYSRDLALEVAEALPMIRSGEVIPETNVLLDAYETALAARTA